MHVEKPRFCLSTSNFKLFGSSDLPNPSQQVQHWRVVVLRISKTRSEMLCSLLASMQEGASANDLGRRHIVRDAVLSRPFAPNRIQQCRSSTDRALTNSSAQTRLGHASPCCKRFPSTMRMILGPLHRTNSRPCWYVLRYPGVLYSRNGRR